jgi:8-oxo-dGTP diphosphatase
MIKGDETYPRPIATVDLTIFRLAPSALELLLIRRAAEPFAGAWALPGGWIHVDEDQDLEAAARRVLAAKTGVETPYLEQLQTIGNAGRDPRGWSVSIAYMALIGTEDGMPSAAGSDVAWAEIAGTGVSAPLAFDHAEILAAALARLRGKVEYSSLPAYLLPERFTLGDLQSVYERILGRRLDKSGFRKRIAEAGFVEPIPGALRRASNRPAQLYRLKAAAAVLFDRTI